MSLLNWIFDAWQHSRITDARQETERLRHEMASLRSGRGLDEDRLLQALGELALAVKTVQRLCIEKGLCTDAEFRQRAREIDHEDGLADGRSTPPR
jgi:hypothetical protein